ncbi:MAG: hypothetical protein U0905_12685 [Pirellulales bacterium]
MKLLPSLDRLRLPLRRKDAAGPVVFVHWDREKVYYLVQRSSNGPIRLEDFGSIAIDGDRHPLALLADHLQESSKVQNVIVLLSRPELDVLSLQLPPVASAMLPLLVLNEFEQHQGEAEQSPVVDFVDWSNEDPQASARQVFAYGMSRKEYDKLVAAAEQAGWKLQAITARQWTAFAAAQEALVDQSINIVVQLYPGEVELAIGKGPTPSLLRSFRVSGSEYERIADQILLETQRCLTLLPHDWESYPNRWLLFRTSPEALEVSKFLRERITDPVLELNPLDASNSPLEIDPSLTTYLSTANAGAALEYRSGKLAINLQSPKKPPKPRNRFVTYGALGGLAAAACLTGYYFLLSDVWSLEEEHRTALQTLDNQKKVTAKYHEKADQVLAVENWMSDRVDWLAELNRLSQRLPQGSQATIRRLSASTKNDEAYIDLSVQVAEQETVSQLEQGIRSAKYSVTSKQISQNAESAEYPWQFETQIHFPIEAESMNPPNKQSSKGSAKPASSKAPSKDAKKGVQP